MSKIWMSHVTHLYESCHIHEWVMSHIWMSHVAHVNESCHTYESVMSHVSFICCHDSFICCHGSYVATTHSYIATTRSYMWHDSYICVTWLIHMLPRLIHTLPWLDHTLPWLIHMCDMTNPYFATTHSTLPWLEHMCHDSIICAMTDPTELSYGVWLNRHGWTRPVSHLEIA